METVAYEWTHEEEWVKLIKEAKSLGLTTEEVRMFLSGSKNQINGVC